MRLDQNGNHHPNEAYDESIHIFSCSDIKDPQPISTTHRQSYKMYQPHPERMSLVQIIPAIFPKRELFLSMVLYLEQKEHSLTVADRSPIVDFLSVVEWHLS